MKNLRRYIASFLLALFAFAIFPLESIHHHEEYLAVCKDASSHYHVHHIDCDLCDFVIQKFTSSSAELKNTVPYVYYTLSETELEQYNYTSFQIPQYRGPPSLV